MATGSVYDTFKDYLTTTWGATYPVRDWEEIEILLQQEADPWLALEDASGSQQLKSIGTPDQNHAEDVGFVIIHGFVKSTGKLVAARTILDAVRADLQFRTFSQTATERLRVLTIAPPISGIIHDGLWHSMILTVDFSHQYIAATAVS